MIIGVRGAVESTLRVQKPTDQSWSKPLILYCEEIVVSEMASEFFHVFEGYSLVRSSGLGCVLGRSSAPVILVFFMVLIYGRDTALEGCMADLQCSLQMVLGLSGGAVFTLLLVYVSNRWIDKSIYPSLIWQLHHMWMYASLGARIGSTFHEHFYCILVCYWKMTSIISNLSTDYTIYAQAYSPN